MKPRCLNFVSADLVHSLEITTAKVADGVMTDALLHGDERVVLGERAYTRNDRTLFSHGGNPL